MKSWGSGLPVGWMWGLVVSAEPFCFQALAQWDTEGVKYVGWVDIKHILT